MPTPEEIAAVATTQARIAARRLGVPAYSLTGPAYVEVARCAANMKPGGGSLATYAARCVPLRLIDELSRDTGYRRPWGKGRGRVPLEEMLRRRGAVPRAVRTACDDGPDERAVKLVSNTSVGVRTRDIVELLARGLTQTQAAVSLGIPTVTVHSYIRRLRGFVVPPAAGSAVGD